MPTLKRGVCIREMYILERSVLETGFCIREVSVLERGLWMHVAFLNFWIDSNYLYTLILLFSCNQQILLIELL